MLGYIAIIFATASSVCSFWHREVDKLRRHRVVGVQGRPRVRGKEGKGHSLEQDVFGVTIIEAPRRKLARIKARCAHRFGGILRGATARVFERHIAENYVMEGPFAPVQRAAYSPSEFAALFGKSATWGYRQLYSGRVNAITGDGRLMIPASEVAKISGKAAVYDGKPPAKKKKRDKKPPVVPQPKTWQQHVKSRREVRSHFTTSSASRRIAKIFDKNTAKDKPVTPPQNGPS